MEKEAETQGAEYFKGVRPDIIGFLSLNVGLNKNKGLWRGVESARERKKRKHQQHFLYEGSNSVMLLGKDYKFTSFELRIEFNQSSKNRFKIFSTEFLQLTIFLAFSIFANQMGGRGIRF
jgi:hypothetical protein